MRINQLRKIGIFFVGICLITGCAKVPEIQEGGITSKAKRSDSDIVADIMQSNAGDLSQYDFIKLSENGYTCRVSLGDGERKLNIEAEIENTGEKNVPVLEAKSNITEWDEDRIQEAFFAGKDGVEDVTVQAEQEAATEEIGEGQIQIVFSFMPFSHFLKLRSQDNTELEIKDTALFYSDVLAAGKKRAEEKREIETDISQDFTIDMAWNMVAERFREAGLGDIKKQCAFAIYYAEGKAEYGMTFTAMVNGLPLVTPAGSVSVDDLATNGYTIVTEDGIAEIQSENAFWEIQSEKEEKILNIGQLMGLLEQYIANGRIRCSDNIVFKKCELSYFLSTTDWKTATLTPAWRIYIPLQEVLEDRSLSNTSYPLDIVIDAVTGDIIRME